MCSDITDMELKIVSRSSAFVSPDPFSTLCVSPLCPCRLSSVDSCEQAPFASLPTAWADGHTGGGWGRGQGSGCALPKLPRRGSHVLEVPF